VAKSARPLFPSEKPDPNSFSGEGLSLWLGEEKVGPDLKNTLYAHFMKHLAKKELCNKSQLSPSQFQSIHWEAIAKAADMMSPTSNQWTAKFVTKCLPIGRNMVRRNHWRKDYCPRCRIATGTHDHLLH